MAILDYEHWRDVPPSEWRWPNFSPAEMACRGTGKLKIDTDAMSRLQKLRTELGIPINVVSAYRSPEHNKAVGGKSNSAHMLAAAFDVSMANHDPVKFVEAARRAGFSGIGRYPARGQNFIHVDTGAHVGHKNLRTWGGTFPLSSTRFDAEAKPTPVLKTGTGKSAAQGLVAAASTAVAALADGAEGLVGVARNPVLSMAAGLVPWIASAIALLAVAGLVLAILRKRKTEAGIAGE